MMDEAEIPTQGLSEYILVPAEAASGQSSSQGVTVFCIDTSGSMCVTTPVPELQGIYLWHSILTSLSHSLTHSLILTLQLELLSRYLEATTKGWQ